MDDNVIHIDHSSMVNNANIIGNIQIDRGSNWAWDSTYSQSIRLGFDDGEKTKIYIVEPWQSTKPIKINDNLWVSLENDLISNDKIKSHILDKLTETHPELVIKLGANPDNLMLVKSEVNLEINKDIK